MQNTAASKKINYKNGKTRKILTQTIRDSEDEKSIEKVELKRRSCVKKSVGKLPQIIKRLQK